MRLSGLTRRMWGTPYLTRRGLWGCWNRWGPCRGSRSRGRQGKGALVYPRYGNPLRLRCQTVHGLNDLVQGVVEVVVDDDQVEVLVISALQLGTVLHGALEVVLLSG